MDWKYVLISALIQSLVGALIYFAFRRPMERVGELEKEVRDLKDNRVSDLEDRIAVSEKYGRDRREKIYQRLTKLEETSRKIVDCKEEHREMAHGMAEYRGAVIDLAKVQEKLAGTAEFISEVNQRVIGLAADVARMEGEQHGSR